MTTQPSDWAVAPKFGEWLRGIYASERNPLRDGMYVRTIRRTGRCNPGTFYELTDGNGKFWQYPRQSVIRLDRARELDASGGGDSPMGMCCYGYPRRRSDCASCSAWSPGNATPQPAEPATTNSAQISSSLVVGEAGDDGYYLASFKRSHDRGYVVWWMPNDSGYTTDLEQAGIYTEIKKGYHDSEYTVPVPVSFVRGLRVRRMVDVGDSLNRALWTAESLRAAMGAVGAGGGEHG